MLFIDMHVMPRTRQLLGCGKARWPRAHNSDFFAGLVLGRLWNNPALVPTPINDCTFDGFNGDRCIIEVERAGSLAGCGANPARKFREIIGRMEVAQRLLPIAVIDEIIPVRNLVIHRTAVMAVRNAAIHAARRLIACGLFRQGNNEFLVVANTV